MSLFLRFLLPILTGCALAAPAFAQTVINSVPYTINTSGKYVLGSNLVTASANQNAIVISANNVILDLNGFFVSGPANNTASTVALISVGNVSNVTIRNGTVANNGTGIFFNSGANSINHLVEDVNVTRCLNQGIYFIDSSAGSIVRRNVISQTGGSTAFANSNAFGIITSGGVRVEKNVVSGVTPTGTGVAFGIAGLATDFMIANTLSGAAGAGSIGVNGGKYQRNLTSGFSTPVSGGTDAGGNNSTSSSGDGPVAKQP